MNTTVFHLASLRDVPPFATDGEIARFAAQQILAKAYSRVAVVETTDLDRAYELTNNINQAWTQNAGVVAVSEKARSTSVGDVMIDSHGIPHVVAGCGFVSIPFSSSMARRLNEVQS
jgi:hypothetical protein